MIVISAEPEGTRVTYTRNHGHDEHAPNILVEQEFIDMVELDNGEVDIVMLTQNGIPTPRYNTPAGLVFMGHLSIPTYLWVNGVPWFKVHSSTFGDCWSVVEYSAPEEWRIR